jgi:hypothetical protein
LKRKEHPEELTKKESPTKSIRRTVEDDEKQFNQGYLLLQSGGRSRYIENTFWACADIEVIIYPLCLFAVGIAI